MKILITDGLSKEGQKILKDAGIDFDIQFYELPELIRVIPNYDGILVRSATNVPKEVIDAGKNLKLIARAGAGIDNIDHKYAKLLGIPVLNTPAANSLSVAELVFAHLFALARFIPQANITMREGKWEKKSYAKGIELSGKTIGIVGFGKIGQLVAKIALAIGMKVLAYDVAEIKTDLDVKIVPLDELLRNSDFITLHTPKQPHPLIGVHEIETMKTGVFIVNCARGGVIDEKALLSGLNSGKVGGAGLDVYSQEPPDNLELIRHPRVSATPHTGASTVEAQDRVGVEIAQKIMATLKK
ncbi:MAG: D-2-hydroxyacid dehydrogenase [Candidatus Neomarinimicrobiota bacterium]